MDVVSFMPRGVLPSRCTSDPCLTDLEPRLWESSSLSKVTAIRRQPASPGLAALQAAALNMRMKGRGRHPCPCGLSRRSRYHFLCLLCHECQACQVPGGSDGTHPPDPHRCEPPTCVVSFRDLRSALGSGQQAKQGREVWAVVPHLVARAHFPGPSLLAPQTSTSAWSTTEAATTSAATLWAASSAAAGRATSC